MKPLSLKNRSLKSIFAAAAMGGTWTAGLALAAMPVAVPGTLALYGLLGVAGGAAIGAAYPKWRAETNRKTKRRIGMIFAAMALTAGALGYVGGMESFDAPLRAELKSLATKKMGSSWMAAERGRSYSLKVPVAGKVVPVTATVDRGRSIMDVSFWDRYFSRHEAPLILDTCVIFNVKSKRPSVAYDKKARICKTRPMIAEGNVWVPLITAPRQSLAIIY